MMLTKESFILIIEDNIINREVMKLLLRNGMGQEYVEEWAESGRFLERLRELPQKPNLIIMDIRIKPHDGFEMIQQLRADSQYDDVKVVAYTASVMQEQISQMKMLGFDGLISKPITRDIFPELLRRIMAGESIWYIS